MRTRFTIQMTTCRRCGKALATGSRSLYGADAAKARLDRICRSCITPEEQAEIELAVNAAVFKTLCK